MFTNYMPYNPTTNAFLAWKKCLSKNVELREKLTLPQDKDEDMRMCRKHYETYMNEALKIRRKELHIKQ
jgi:hypothetical protein